MVVTYGTLADGHPTSSLYLLNEATRTFGVILPITTVPCNRSLLRVNKALTSIAGADDALQAIK